MLGVPDTWETRQEECMSPGVCSCSELGSHHCTQVWLTERDPLSKIKILRWMFEREITERYHVNSQHKPPDMQVESSWTIQSQSSPHS